MLTLIPLLNPPRRAKKKSNKKRRKPPGETSAAVRARRKKRRRGRKQEVATMASRRRKRARRGAGGRFVKGGKAKRSRRRRRKNPLGGVGLAAARLRRVRSEAGATKPKRRRRKSTKRRATKARTLRRGTYRVNPRRRRRNPLVVKRTRRRGGRTRTVYLTKRKRHGRRSAFRRLNPGRSAGRGLISTVKNLFTVNTALSGLQVGAGIVIDRAAPTLIARYVGMDLDTGWKAVATGLGANVVVSVILSALGQQNAAAKILLGGVGSTGARVLQQAIGYAGGGGRATTRRVASGATNGLGSVVSPETMVETQALLGDFVQLQGGIPIQDLRGVRGLGDYVEFQNQAAGAQAMSAQLAPTAVFSPGADEKF